MDMTNHLATHVKINEIIVPEFDKSDKRYSKEEILRLCKSIQAIGLLHPIIVTPIPVKAKKGEIVKYKIVDGIRRYLAYRVLAKKYKKYEEVPVLIVRNVDDLAILINELQEKYSPITLARIFKSLRDKGYSITKIANACGRSKSYVSELLKILESPLIAEALEKEEIDIKTAIEILRCSTVEHERAELLERVRGKPRKEALYIINKYKKGLLAKKGGVRPSNTSIQRMRHCHLCIRLCEKGEYQNLTLCNDCYSSLITLYNMVTKEGLSLREFLRLWKEFYVWYKSRR